jgi:hypothetical protein
MPFPRCGDESEAFQMTFPTFRAEGLTTVWDILIARQGPVVMLLEEAVAGALPVKPLALMRHLARLVVPPGGTVLDPFCGSGTTGMACVFEGFGFVGVEQEPAYAEIAEARIAHAEELVARGYAVLPEGRRGRPDDEPGQMSLL